MGSSDVVILNMNKYITSSDTAARFSESDSDSDQAECILSHRRERLLISHRKKNYCKRPFPPRPPIVLFYSE